MGESAVWMLKRLGLSEYEARVYLSLLKGHYMSASLLSMASGVPRTKIYDVLRSLRNKGWVRIYSGFPLLFKAIPPPEVFDKVKRDFESLIEAVQAALNVEGDVKMERFLVKRADVGLRALKEEISEAETVWISNATTEFLKDVYKSFKEDSEVKIILYPGEEKVEDVNAEFRKADVKIICMVRGVETPSIAVITNEERIFTVYKDPLDGRYMVEEMLYEECSKCFIEWFHLGWESAERC